MATNRAQAIDQEQPIDRAATRDLRDWLTREQASDLLGVSVNTITRWERAGKLHPQRRRGGRGRIVWVWVYEPAELASCPRHRDQRLEPGEVCARVFEMLDKGHSTHEIVIACRQTISAVEELREQWLESGGGELVVSHAMKAELERVVGPFESLAELCKRIAELARGSLSTPGVGV